MTDALIEARALGKSFGPTPVLRDVNLSVEAGCGTAVIGANGAGKSTLIRLLAGLSAPSLGAALLFGEPARALRPQLRRRVGLLSHQSFVYPNLTARENLEFYATLYGVEDARAAAIEWLERVALGAAAEARVRGFSRGMEQRLALARAMLARPDVLMLDEPFAALDAFTREELWGVMQSLWLQHRFSAILVTHDLREAVYLADRVFVMSKKPARVIFERTIDLPRPRTVEGSFEPHFIDLVHELRGKIIEARS
jgi:NitT/TauT family transport system ATP-binding protein